MTATPFFAEADPMDTMGPETAPQPWRGKAADYFLNGPGWALVERKAPPSTLLLVRGLPGSGKTTFAQGLQTRMQDWANQGKLAAAQAAAMVAKVPTTLASAANATTAPASQVCIIHDIRNYLPAETVGDQANPVTKDILMIAHKACRVAVESSLARGIPLVIVTNGFTAAWEAKPYLQLVLARHPYRAAVLDLGDAFGCSSHELASRASPPWNKPAYIRKLSMSWTTGEFPEEATRGLALLNFAQLQDLTKYVPRPQVPVRASADGPPSPGKNPPATTSTDSMAH